MTKIKDLDYFASQTNVFKGGAKQKSKSVRAKNKIWKRNEN